MQTIIEKESTLIAFVDYIEGNMKLLNLISGVIDTKSNKDFIKFLNNQKTLFIQKERTIMEDL